jgi:hypothetical protein
MNFINTDCAKGEASMRSVKTVGFLMGICAVVIALWTSNRNACANDGNPVVKWTYVQLVIEGDKIVLMNGSKESTITPPTNPPTGPDVLGPQSSSRYTITSSKSTRNTTVEMLNFCGSEGWEVVSSTPSNAGTLILLKRPY